MRSLERLTQLQLWLKKKNATDPETYSKSCRTWGLALIWQRVVTLLDSRTLSSAEVYRSTSSFLREDTGTNTKWHPILDFKKKKRRESEREKQEEITSAWVSKAEWFNSPADAQLGDTRLLLNESKKLLKDFIHPAPADGDKLFSPFSQVFSFHHWDADEETQTNQTVLQIAFSVYYSKH